jgi:hypothetical protein
VETDPDVGSPATFIARTAIGRMVRDFEAAGNLDNLEVKDQRTFASFDPPRHCRSSPTPGQRC